MSDNNKKSKNDKNKKANTESKTDQAKKYSDLGNEYFSDGKVAEAIPEYNKAIELDSQNPEYFFNRGISHLSSGEIEKGLEDFDTVKKINPDGEFAKRIDQFFESIHLNRIEELTEKIRLDSSNALLYKERGKAYQSLKMYKEAIADFQKAIKLKIDDKDIYFHQGDSYFAEGDFEQAYNNYIIGLEKGEYSEIDDELANKFRRIADYFLQQDSFDKAIGVLNDIRDYNHIYFLLNDIHEEMLEFQSIKDRSEAESQTRNILLEKYKNVEEFKKSAKQKEKKIQELKNKLERMMQQYTHTLANTLFPNTIYEVANKLKSHVEFKKDARILAEAYHAELIIKRQGQLLQARNSSKKEFQLLIRGDRLDLGTSEQSIDVEAILNNAIERVISRFLNEDYHKLDAIREIICKNKKTTMDSLRSSFEENVFFNTKMSPLEFTNSHFLNISFSMTDMWKNIRLKKDNYAEALLQGYFGELLFNALKYRNVQNDQWINIIFKEDKIDGKDYLISEWKNPVVKDATIGKGNGLLGIKNDLEMLNETEEPKKSLDYLIRDATFEIMLVFKADLFVPNPKLKIDRNKLAEIIKKENI